MQHPSRAAKEFHPRGGRGSPVIASEEQDGDFLYLFFPPADIVLGFHHVQSSPVHRATLVPGKDSARALRCTAARADDEAARADEAGCCERWRDDDCTRARDRTTTHRAEGA
ncbi:hypothetical protein AAFF_G00120460 [Aldrovandia affinis]|uniref:Uncharacterized protein n=1 Tax=Aldrovandia affinis TaxID=143900 RepID=A0AAD7WAB9_9TELE|nr:hypothetical protein AAFF_G00120460 [Aldrovandia affinis]